MELADIFGFLAATCTTVAFVPQVLHVLKTKDTHAISLGMYSIFCLGLGFWLTYGIMLTNWPMIVANATTLLLAGTVLVLKIMHKGH
ncbi:hypothetical protein GC177_00660 [bacterium]|nr:hypothetical protein [bacterium]